MNEYTEAPVPTDVELRALWQQAGGTIYAANREVGSMQIRMLLPFLRRLSERNNGVPAMGTMLFPGEAPNANSAIGHALATLISAACPGLDTSDLLEAARKAIGAFAPGAQQAGYFGIDEDGRHAQVKDEHAGDPDIFPLYRRAALKAETKAAPAPSTKAAKKSGA
jgi:hypothetical protein